MSVPGGVGQSQPATPEVQEIADKVRGELEQKTGHTYTEYKAVSYATQVVAGVNYFIKVDVGGGQFVHLRVFKDFQQHLTLHSYQEGKTAGDELTYF